jgi:hypothetical protein
MITLTKGVTRVQLQNPDLNDVLSIHSHQGVEQRADGKYYRYDLAAGMTVERELRWTELRRSERDNLASFYQDIVHGTLDPFTFTDERGGNWNAHFLNPDLEFATVADDRASATTFVTGGVSVPTTTRSGGVYACVIKLLLWS